jgi:hypothetical protein
LVDFLGFAFMDVIKFDVYCFVVRNLDCGFVYGSSLIIDRDD